MSGDYLISFISADGEEREERWPSVEAFRNWAIGQGGDYRYTAYRRDEDEDEWLVVDQGRVSSQAQARRPKPG